MMMKLRTLLAPMFVSVLVIMGISRLVLAQSDDLEWVTPVNLSHSGAASSPAIVVVPDGTLRIIWWDEFDGLLVADGDASSLRAIGTSPSESGRDGGWSAPTQAPILLPTRVVRDGQERVVPLPIEVMPHVVGDTAGRAHAFWLGEPDPDTNDRALLYSRLTPGRTSWSAPVFLVDSAASFDATADISGTVHVAYVQPVQIGGAPTGMYYRQSSDAGAWSRPVAVQQSRYLRLLPAEGDSLHLTADDSERVYVTWDDPGRGQVLMTYSADGGMIWQEPRPLASSDSMPLRNQLIALPGRSALVLWESSGSGPGTMTASSSGDALTLALWDGARWSETKQLDLRFQDPELGQPLRLSDPQLELVAFAHDQEEAGETLVVVGTNRNDDLWITGVQVADLERLFEPSTDRAMPLEPSAGPVGDASFVPVNLSHSGAASNPTILVGPEDSLRAFWWDQFDGLTVADGDLLASPVLSGTQEVVSVHESWLEPRSVPLPASTTPSILADAHGRVHALWIQEPTKEEQAATETVAWPLMYSRLANDATTWLPAVTLAESAAAFDVAADASGALHLAYMQTVDTTYAPSGVYYRRTEDEGTAWMAPVALDQSRYLRLLSLETAHIRLAADDAGAVYVTWDDPRLEKLLLAYTPDGGRKWETTRQLGDSERQLQHGHLLAIPASETVLVWEDVGTGATCRLNQAPADELFSGTTVSGQPILTELTACPEHARFLPLGERQAMMVAGSGTDALVLAIWDGERWSEPSRLSYSFEDREMGGQVYLDSLQVVEVRLPTGPTEREGDKALIVVGTDQRGDVWATNSQMGTLDVVFAPLPPWSASVSVAESEALPDLPAMASDSEGRVHLLWSTAPVPGEADMSLLYARRDEVLTSNRDEVRWTSPVPVLQSPEGGADQPATEVEGDRLHAVWRGGRSGQIYYSRAFGSDAYAASGWSEPQPLPAPVPFGSWPDIAVDPGGALHVVYAVPVNEGRGIYHTYSKDGDEWSPAHQVFDAAEAGWMMSDHPRLAVDLTGTIHVAWIRTALFGDRQARGIYYAWSRDGGQTWSEALEVAKGAYDWPQVTIGGADRVHLVWNQLRDEPAWWHQWSADGGLNWTRPERVPGLGKVPGPIGLMADGHGTVHIVGLDREPNTEPALLYMVWDDQRWGEREVLRLDLEMEEAVSGVSAALMPVLGQMDVTFREETEQEGGTRLASLLHTQRTVPVVEAMPSPVFTPWPTETPVPTPVPTMPPTPRPDFGQAPPSSSDGPMTNLLPLLLPGALAVVLVAGAFGANRLRTRRRQ